MEHVAVGADGYTDEAGADRNMTGYWHASVRHSAGEYVRGMAHTNGIESFRAMLKRAYVGTFHHLSRKHLQCYVDEFAGRKAVRDADTVDQMASMAAAMAGKQLRHRNLIAQGAT